MLTKRSTFAGTLPARRVGSKATIKLTGTCASFNLSAKLSAASPPAEWPTTMIGLNVTHQALATTEIIAEFRGIGTRLGTMCAELMTFFASTYHRVFGFEHPPVHDPIAVAAVIDPSILRTVAAPVAVELTGTYTRGATVVDLHGRTARTPNADVAIGLEVDAFWRLLMAAVARLGA